MPVLRGGYPFKEPTTMIMTKVKLLRTLERYNLNGFGDDFLNAKKGEVVELTEQQANGLIKSKYVKVTDEPVSNKPEEESDPDKIAADKKAADYKAALDKVAEKAAADKSLEQRKYLRNLEKNDIEEILRGYNVEVDKRKGLESIRQELVEVVGVSLPDKVDSKTGMVKFYAENFKVHIDEKAHEDIYELSVAMGVILSEAFDFKNEDS